MHSYLRAIGYSGVQSSTEEETLVKRAMVQPSQTRLASVKDAAIYFENSKECNDVVGLTVRGELEAMADTADKRYHAEHYFPYFHGNAISLQEQVYISRKIDTQAYHGLCDDSRLGVSLIFFLQNAMDYLRCDDMAGQGKRSVSLSALSLGGHILLPVTNKQQEQETILRSGRKRAQMVAEAKKGNQDAIESLTIEDFDLYSMIAERSRNEDVFSIVDTTFIPYGTESDVYTVLARIESYRYVVNLDTKEELCIMQLCCNNLYFDLCINRADLYGEPEVGRRFRGTVWMQGRVEFQK